jgi:hypothetical protein
MQNKIFFVSIVYIVFEIIVLFGGLTDYYFFHNEDSFLFKYIRVIVITLRSVGLVMLTALTILRIIKKVTQFDFLRNVGLLLLGILGPFLFLYIIISELHYIIQSLKQ